MAVSDNSKPNLVIFITTLNIGGAETVLFRSISSGVYNDFNVYVVSLKGEGFYGRKLKELGVKVISLNLHKLYLLPFGLIKYFALFLRIKPRVVHGWMYHANILACLFAKLRFKPVSCIFSIRHSLNTYDSESPILRFLIQLNMKCSKYSDLLLFNSHVAKSEHLNFGFVSRKIEVIPNGFDTETFYNSSEIRRKYREFFSIPDGVTVIGHIGRYNYLKNQELLVESFTQLLEVKQELRLFLVGRGITDFGEHCKKKYPTSVTKKIYFVDEVDNVNELLSAFDIFCLPSRSEGFPNVLAEAMSCSLPCITTDCGDARLIIHDQKWVVTNQDTRKMTSRLHEMLSLDTAARKQIGEENRKKIEDMFEIELVNKMFKSVLNSFRDKLS